MADPATVMLFAAGFGTRMGALTADRPKPLLKVAGRPLIDYALDLAEGVTPARIVANLHYLPDQLARHLTPKGVALSLEQPEILDTGGGLRAALPLLGDGPVYTLNTDAIWSGPNPLELLAQHWRPSDMDALLMCIPPAQAIGHNGGGDFTRDATGRLRRGPAMVYGGAQIIKTDRLGEIIERAFSLNVLWDIMLRQKRLYGLCYPGKWCDVGHPGGISLAESVLRGDDV